MSDVKPIEPVRPPYPFEDCARLVSHLGQDDGGGYLVTFPDLPGVMAEGDSVEEALRNARDAFESAIAALVDRGRDIPAPTFKPDDVAAPDLPGKFSRACPKASLPSSRGVRVPRACR